MLNQEKLFPVKGKIKKYSPKEGRTYQRIASGQTLAKYQKKTLRFFTLTSANEADENDISRDTDVLIKRIRRKQPEFQYFKTNVYKDSRWHVHLPVSYTHLRAHET